MMDSFSLFDYILLGMGIYVLVSGISGKGRLFTAENIKEGMEEKFHKTMQILYIVLGAVMTLNGGVSLIKYNFYTMVPATATSPLTWEPKGDLGAFSFLTIPVLNVLTYVCMGICLACIVYMIVAIRKMTDKNAPQKKAASNPAAAAQANRQAGHILPVSAFDFDEPETDASSAEKKPE